jgi:serine/threonine protein kinase
VPLVTGPRIGPYEIRAAVGAGGMGEVYRARDTRLERDVALKVLPAETLGDETARARLLREARLASQLKHSSGAWPYSSSRRISKARRSSGSGS